ncbi:MAG: glycosyltransferase [Bacteroidales bacterium]|nr:glycosyltransferase [Bacteroidales bacterium]
MSVKVTAPVALFVYNRLDHLKLSIASLQENPLAWASDLYLFSDGPKDDEDIDRVLKVREFIQSISGFKEIYIFENEKNQGLANSIINGISVVLQEHDKIIVLEDDLLVSSDFLQYMNEALDFYEDKNEVFSISAYCAPFKLNNFEQDTFFFSRINSWGWASWRNRLDNVDWEVKDFNDFIKNKKLRKEFNLGGKDLTTMLLKYKTGIIDSWAIRFNYACFKQKKLNLYPTNSKILNLGIDNSGTNTKKTKKFDTYLKHNKVSFFNEVKEDLIIRELYSNFLSPSIFRQLINKYKILKYIKRMNK